MGIVEKLTEHCFVIIIDQKDGTIFSELAEQVAHIIIHSDRPLIIADFENVPHISSSLLGIVLALNQKLHDVCGEFAICNLREPVLKVFQIIGVDSHIHIFQSRKEALEGMEKIRG